MLTKDNYIWFSPAGEMFDALHYGKFRFISNGVAVHENWAMYRLADAKEGDTRYDIFNRAEKVKEKTLSAYGYYYEVLEKEGWIRYLPWATGGAFGTLETNMKLYTKAIRDAVKGFCLDNGVDLPEEFAPKE